MKYYYAQKLADLWKGPVTLDELKTLTASQKLKRDDLIWHEGMAEWEAAESVAGVFEGLPAEQNFAGISLLVGQCVKCRTVNPGDNRFCSECGALLYEVCPACKVENRVGTKFCGKCGLDIAKYNRVLRLRQQAAELKQRAGQVPGQTVPLLTEARQKLQGILTESPTDETAKNELDQLDENLCAAFLKLASSTSGDEALTIYKRMLLVFPKHPEATVELAWLEQILTNVKTLIEAGNFPEAAKQAVQANNTSGPWAELQALQHRAEFGASLLDQIRTQRSGPALFACRKLLQTFPDNKAARIRLQEIEQRLQELKSSAGESIKAGDYKQAMLDLDKALSDFGSESELQDIVAKGVTGCIAGGVETLLREMANLREQANSGEARVMELSDKLIPSLIQERKYVAVLGCLDELIQLGAGAKFVTETRAKATEEAHAAQAFTERGEQLLAARKPRKAIKEFNNALERCADNQRAIKGREGAWNSNAKSIAIYSGVGLIAIIMLVVFGVSLVSDWRDRNAWSEAQQTAKIAGNDLEHSKQGYQKYLAAFPNGKQVPAAQQALAHIQKVEQARELAERDWQDQSAWSEAQQTAKIAGDDLERSKQGYQKYLVAFPNGNQVPAAQQALAHIQKVEQARELAEQERQSQIYFESGVSKQSKGDLAGAWADYDKAIEQNPGVAKFHNQRGRLKQALGDLTGALADYDQAIALEPDHADGYFNRGSLAQATGNMNNMDVAIAAFTKVIELEPAFADAYNNRGIAKNAKGDADGALVDCNKAIELEPAFADAYNNRGIAKNAKGDLDGAMKDYDKAIEINPQFADAYFDRGLVGEAKGNLDGALTDYNRAVELNAKLANQDWLNALTKKIRQQKLAEEERQRQLAEQEKQRQRLAEEKQRQLILQENAKKAEKIKQLAEACFASARAADRNRAYSQQTGLMIYYGTEAIKSYTNFIKLASPGDERISEAQEAIAHIQGEIRMLRM